MCGCGMLAQQFLGTGGQLRGYQSDVRPALQQQLGLACSNGSAADDDCKPGLHPQKYRQVVHGVPLRFRTVGPVNPGPARTAGGYPRGRAGLGVQAAFALLRLFPPPAPGAMVLARHDGPGAGRAANAGIALFVQAVEGKLARADIGPDLLLGPVQQRADLVQAVLGVPLNGLALGARLATARDARP